MFIKREGKDDCIVAGMAVGNMKEKEYEGNKFYEVGISMGKDAGIVNVAIWHRKPVDIKKYDKVLALGRLKVAKKEDKTYYSLDADFVAKEDSVKVQENIELTPVEDDEDLPF